MEGTHEDRPGVVVGEGHPARRGLLRFVLEGEGFDVLAETTTTVELVHALAIHRPDAVILDDGIGVTAVVVVREMVPQAKVILVWPSDVIPIGGDARIDPTDVLRELGAVLERTLELDRPEPEIGTVHHLPTGASTEAGHGSANHPSSSSVLAPVLPGPGLPRSLPEDDAIIVDREPAPLLILPVSPRVADDE